MALIKEHILILGAGAIGLAIEKILGGKKYQIELWDKDTSKVPGQKLLADAAGSADVIFLCIPSSVVREALSLIKPNLTEKKIIVSLSKGIEAATGKTMDEVLSEILPAGQPFALLSGPMLAQEFMHGKHGSAVVASADAAARKMLADLFADTILRTEPSDDVRGVALVGVLKNIYAIALGIADGLGWGENEKGRLVASATSEMAEIACLLGGTAGAALSCAGLGDLVATGFSVSSFNHRCGDSIAKTGTILSCEGVSSMPSLAGKVADIKPFPIFAALKSIIVERADAKRAFESLVR